MQPCRCHVRLRQAQQARLRGLLRRELSQGAAGAGVVEPHLSSSPVSTLRHLALFFALGLGVFGLKYAFAARAPRPLLVVHVAPQATSEDVERAIDEAVLVDQSLARGGALLDPV